MATLGQLQPDHVTTAQQAAKGDHNAWGVLGDMLQESGYDEVGQALSRYATADVNNPQPNGVWHTASPRPSDFQGLGNGEFFHNSEQQGAEVFHRVYMRIPGSGNHMFWWRERGFKLTRRRVSYVSGKRG